MNTTQLSTDQTILEDLAKQLRQQRIALNMTQAELAKQSGISKRSLERLESGASVQLSNFIRVLRALGLLEQFTQLSPEPIASPILQLQQQKKQRSRASSTKNSSNSEWTWEDEA